MIEMKYNYNTNTKEPLQAGPLCHFRTSTVLSCSLLVVLLLLPLADCDKDDKTYLYIVLNLATKVRFY